MQTFAVAVAAVLPAGALAAARLLLGRNHRLAFAALPGGGFDTFLVSIRLGRRLKAAGAEAGQW